MAPNASLSYCLLGTLLRGNDIDGITGIGISGTMWGADARGQILSTIPPIRIGRRVRIVGIRAQPAARTSSAVLELGCVDGTQVCL